MTHDDFENQLRHVTPREIPTAWRDEILPSAQTQRREEKPSSAPWLAWLSPARVRPVKRSEPSLFARLKPAWGFFTVAGITGFVALLIVEENFAAQRAWEEYQQNATARANAVDFMSLVPPPVPDDQNFAMTPLLAPLFEGPNRDLKAAQDYKAALTERLNIFKSGQDDAKRPKTGDWQRGRHFDAAEWTAYFGTPTLLDALKKVAPEMDEITSASRRPYARFPIQWEKGFSAELPHAFLLKSLSQLFELRAAAQLGDGRTDSAAADVHTIFRLANTLKGEPVLISQLVRVAMFQRAIQVIWEGMSAHRWSENQLAEFQSAFGEADVLAYGRRAFLGERAMGNETFKKMKKDPRFTRAIFTNNLSALGEQDDDSWSNAAWSLVPGFLFDQNIMEFNRHHDEGVLPAIAPESHRVFPKIVRDGDERIAELRKSRSFFTPHLSSILASALVPSLTQCMRNLAFRQVVADEFTIACALERHRLAQGVYPEALTALVPRFIEKLPCDVMSGEPLKYWVSGDSFTLYSVGWNETDDGGNVSVRESGEADLDEGDWVLSITRQ